MLAAETLTARADDPTTTEGAEALCSLYNGVSKLVAP